MGVLCQSCDLRLLFRVKSGFGCVERVSTSISLLTEEPLADIGQGLLCPCMCLSVNLPLLTPVGQRRCRMGNTMDLFC